MQNTTQFYNGPDKYSKRFPTLLAANLALVAFILLADGVGLVYSVFTGAQQSFAHSFAGGIVDILVSELLIILPSALIILNITRADFVSTVRLKKRISVPQILLLALVSLGVIYFANACTGLWTMGLKAFGYKTLDETGYGTSMPSTLVQAIYMALLYGLLPAVCEELFFRGLIMRAYERYSAFTAVFASALLFGLMHRNIEQLPFAFIVGLVLGVVVLISDSIWASFTIHFINNAFAMLYNYSLTLSSGEAQQETTTVAVLPQLFFQLFIGAVILGGGLALFIVVTRRRNRIKYGGQPEELTPGFAEKLRLSTYGPLVTSPAGRHPFLSALPMLGFVASDIVQIFAMILLTSTQLLD